MPRQAKSQKAHVESSSSSSRSYSSCESLPKPKPAPKPCRACPELRLSCAPQIGVTVIPEIKCQQLENKEGHMKVAMRVKSFPSCELKHVGKKQVSDCETVCFYDLAVKVRHECDAQILDRCNLPTATFRGDITTRIVQTCGEANDSAAHGSH